MAVAAPRTRASRVRGRRGTGTYKELPNGKILHSFALPVGEDGLRRRGSVTGNTEAECRELAVRKIADARLTPQSKETIAEYLPRWLKGLRGRAPGTIDNYGTMIRALIIPVLGPKRIGELTHRDVERMIAANKDRGLASTTVNLARTVLGIAMKDALRDGTISANPVELARTLRTDRREVEPLTAESVASLLAFAHDTRWWPYYVVSVNTGMRPGELLALRWPDVTGPLHVEHTLHRYKRGVFALEAPKTGTSRRTLPLLEPVRLALEVQRTNQERERTAAGDAWSEWGIPGLVFRTPQGHPVDRDEVLAQFKKDLKTLGLREQPYKDLRHTCATYLLGQGVPMEVVSKILGHASMAITSAVYAKVSQALMERALGKLGSIGDQIGEQPAAEPVRMLESPALVR